MINRKNSERILRSPASMIAIVIAMLSVILVVTVLSSRGETLLQEKQKSTTGTETRPADAGEHAVITSASEGEVIISEDGNLPVMTKSGGHYFNDRRLSIRTGYGMSFYIGLEQSGMSDALYLNPHFEYEYAGNPDEAYGYLMRTERIPLEYAEALSSPAWSTQHKGLTDFVIRGRTYDKVVSATMTDSRNYGVRWVDSPGFGGYENGGDRIHILIIRLSDGTLMGAVNADTSYDSARKRYQIDNLENSDVAETGELTTQQRELLIQDTIQYLINGNAQMTLGLTEEELKAQSLSIVVEKTPRTYYNRLYDTEGNVVSSGRFSNCDIYAVNLNCDGYGFFTVYFAPEPQAYGLAARTLEGNDELKLVLIGYDAFCPFTTETFNSFIHPEDIEMFATAED